MRSFDKNRQRIEISSCKESETFLTKHVDGSGFICLFQCCERHKKIPFILVVSWL